MARGVGPDRLYIRCEEMGVSTIHVGPLHHANWALARLMAPAAKAENPFMRMHNRCVTDVACVCVTLRLSWHF